MAPAGTAQYLTRFNDRTIACNQYVLTKLGLVRAHCFFKIEEYMILCVPFQLAFKRSVFIASLSKQEVNFFQRYMSGMVGLSIAFNPEARPEPIKFFIHCTLNSIGQMKGRDDVGVLVVDFKSTPGELINILGGFMETQERIKIQYEDYGKTAIRMTADAARIMGYNMYAVILEPKAEPRRIQVFNISSKTVEHMEGVGAPVRAPGTVVVYQLFFRKYRISVTGTVSESTVLPQGIVRTLANLAFNPELVEVVDDYWYNSRINTKLNSLF